MFLVGVYRTGPILLCVRVACSMYCYHENERRQVKGHLSASV
jgi:hypothetical protein